MAYTAIDDPSAHHQTVIYTGNGSSRSLTNTGNSNLQPDLVWTKKRSAVQNHCVTDSTRGVGNIIFPDDSGAESATALLTSFDSDGFSINNNALVNENTATYVAWQWKANGGTRVTFTESGANPAGGYQANTTAGFSIVDYTGTGTSGGTVAHGLGVQPEMVWVKRRQGTANWCVKTTHIDDGNVLFLDISDAESNTSTPFNDTDPDTTVFTIGDNQATNENDGTYVAYCWAPKQGYSKFGSYLGSGNVDGPFVYTGFKPAWLLIKRTSTAGTWSIWDNKRDEFNVVDRQLKAESTEAEVGGYWYVDFLSNGFKVRATDAEINEDGGTLIYMAFAEQSFVSSGGVPCTGR